MRKSLWIAVVALAAFLAGCSGTKAPVAEIVVRSENMAFDKQEITIRQGEPVRLVLQNSDVVLHDWSIAKINAKVTTKQKGHAHEMGGLNPDLHVSADASKKAAVDFTALEPGVYEFFCAVVGHKEAGMVGRLVVQ